MTSTCNERLSDCNAEKSVPLLSHSNQSTASSNLLNCSITLSAAGLSSCHRNTNLITRCLSFAYFTGRFGIFLRSFLSSPSHHSQSRSSPKHYSAPLTGYNRNSTHYQHSPIQQFIINKKYSINAASPLFTTKRNDVDRGLFFRPRRK